MRGRARVEIEAEAEEEIGAEDKLGVQVRCMLDDDSMMPIKDGVKCSLVLD